MTPNEIRMRQVFSQVGEKGDFLNLSPHPDIDEKEVEEIAQSLKGHKIRRVDLSGCNQLTKGVFQTLLLFKTTLTSLNLSYCRKIEREGFFQINSFTNLTQLNLKGCDIPPTPFFQADPLLIEELDVSNTNFAPKNLPNLRNLESLKLNYCPRVNATTFQYIADAKKLTTLELNGLVVTEKLLKKMASLKVSHLSLMRSQISYSQISHLKHEHQIPCSHDPWLKALYNPEEETLNLEGITLRDDEIDQILEHTSLKSLTLTKCHIKEAQLKRFSKLSSLKEFCFSDSVCEMGGADSWLFLNDQKGLISLTVRKSEGVDLAGLQSASLQSLCLDQIEVEQDTIRMIQKLPSLTSLFLMHCVIDQKTANGLLSSIQKMGLESLCLQGYHFITNEDLTCLEGSETLTYLNISDCIKLTEEVFHTLCQLKKLKELDLSGCFKMTRGAVDFALEKCKALKKVHTRNCPLIDGDEMEQKPMLQRIRIRRSLSSSSSSRLPNR